MLEKLYFWKGNGGAGSVFFRLIMVLLVVVVLLSGGGGAYWYYYIKVPADEALAQQQQAADKIKADIAAVKKWYEKSLDGGDINFGIQLLDEIHRAYLPLRLLKLQAKDTRYTCTLKSCQITLTLESGVIVTQPEIHFFGQSYRPIFPIKKGKNNDGKNPVLMYNDLKIKSSANPLLTAYKKGKPLSLYACDDVISYIKAYNSARSNGNGKGTTGEIIYKSLPASPVAETAKRLSGQVKSYDMLAGEWSMELKNKGDIGIRVVGEISAQVALYKQAYREAFLIRKIETIKDGIKVSGGLVCKA